MPLRHSKGAFGSDSHPEKTDRYASNPFRDSQSRASRPWVTLPLLLRRADRTPVDQSEAMPGCTLGLIGRARAVFRLLSHKPLHNAIFKRVEGDDRQPAAGPQELDALRQGPFERGQFVIDRDP